MFGDRLIDFLYVFFLGVAFSLLLFLAVYRSTKKAYNSNKMLQEAIKYTFDQENILIEGKSFNGQFLWNKTYKVEEYSKFILIYQSNRSSNLIPKRVLSEEELSSLKELIRSIPNLKQKLKK